MTVCRITSQTSFDDMCGLRGQAQKLSGYMPHWWTKHEDKSLLASSSASGGTAYTAKKNAEEFLAVLSTQARPHPPVPSCVSLGVPGAEVALLSSSIAAPAAHSLCCLMVCLHSL